MESWSDWNKTHLHEGNEVYAMIYFGEKKFCKTEADAREAAELLKAFFEAKERGKATRLIVEGNSPKLSLAFQHGYFEGKRDGYNDGLTAAREIAEGKKEIDKARERDRLEAMQIAELAAVIFAHNSHNFDERRAVESAAKIVELSRKHEK